MWRLTDKLEYKVFALKLSNSDYGSLKICKTFSQYNIYSHLNIDFDMQIQFSFNLHSTLTSNHVWQKENVTVLKAFYFGPSFHVVANYKTIFVFPHKITYLLNYEETNNFTIDISNVRYFFTLTSKIFYFCYTNDK